MKFCGRLPRIAISRWPQKQLAGNRTKRFARFDYYRNDTGVFPIEQRDSIGRRNTSVQLCEQVLSTAPNNATQASAGRAGYGGYRLMDITDHG